MISGYKKQQNPTEGSRRGRGGIAAAVMVLCFAFLFTFAGCGSDEVISVSDLGKSSDTTEANADDGTGAGTSDGENGAEDSDGEGTGVSEIDVEEVVGIWDEDVHTYTNTALDIELVLSEDWTADTSTEGGIILDYEKDGLTANVEFVFDIGGAYADTDAAWDGYYEYMDMDEDSLLLLAASAYAAYDIAVIGGEEFETLTMVYDTETAEVYRYVAVGETEGCIAVLMLSIEAEGASFDTEEAAQNAMQEMVDTLMVW